VYQVETELPEWPKADVGIVRFFSLRDDPGALKRTTLFVPKAMSVAAAWRAWSIEINDPQ
jgi:hypothetical protein